jgi:hypothetical protein
LKSAWHKKISLAIETFLTMTFNNSFQDFALFLYIHVALADRYLHPSEEEVILGKIEKLFPEEEDKKKKFDDAVKQYESLSPLAAMETIRTSFVYFDRVNFALKYKVYIDMYDVVNADGKVEGAEKLALNALKEIINMNEGAEQA